MATLTDVYKRLDTLHSAEKQLDALQNIILSAKLTQQFIEDFSRQNRRIAKIFDDDLRSDFALRGWFIAGSLDHKQIQQLSQAFKEGRESEIEEFLVDHTKRHVADIMNSALKRWPNRSQILRDAFGAHSAQKYTLSVPVLLSQADGISFDLLGSYLFTKSKGKISDKVSKLIKDGFCKRPLAESFLGLLLYASGLHTRTDERDEQKDDGQAVSPLNRHGVLHGLDCDYATEENSLRCFALIQFLGWVAELTKPGQSK